MAKVTITFTDTKKGMDMKVEFTPALKRGQKLTIAQQMGMEISEAAGKERTAGISAAMDLKTDE